MEMTTVMITLHILLDLSNLHFFINDIKYRLSSTSYDELLREERTYLQEVSTMEKKFESWSQLPAPATAAADVKKAAGAVTVSLPPAVAAFEV